MANRQETAAESARQARAAAIVCAGAMLGIVTWLVWRHGIGSLITLDAERLLTLQSYMLAHAVALASAAQPKRALSGAPGAQLAFLAAAGASANVIAATFFAVDAGLVWSFLSTNKGPIWVLGFIVPAGASVLLLINGFGVPPEAPDEISDDDLTEAALILTEAQRRWSWKAVFAMAEYMALSRALILATYFLAVVAGIAVFQWLNRALFETDPLTSEALRATAVGSVEQARAILSQGLIWGLFILIAVVPPLLILTAAAWYRFQLRRERVRLRALSQSPAAQIMTPREAALWRREEWRSARAAVRQRSVS